LISRIRGTLVTRDADGVVEIETSSGVTYEVEVPLTVMQRIPMPPAAIELHIAHLVREDSEALYGFNDSSERTLFLRLLKAHGVGKALALAMMSTFTASRLARAITEKDLTALTQVSGVGKRTAEKIVVELSDKVADLAFTTPLDVAAGSAPLAQEAVAALVAMGLSFGDADKAVRAVVEEGGAKTSEELIRKALARRVRSETRGRPE
jgi:holliday junction DNA helicase RuvA